MITILVNDEPRSVAVPTVAALLSQFELPTRGIAVAVNGEVVRRADWPEHRLSEGDTVEVLTAVQGG